jgi:multidrug resistance efflux pump
MATVFSGVILSPLYELRFPFSGKITHVNKKLGDVVQKGESIASLDRRLRQIELDRQLADYEKVRASFELFIIKYGPNDSNDEVKYMRQEKQSALNASVKEVEVAKYNLDLSSLICPIRGVIIEMNNLVPNMHITPSGSAVVVSSLEELFFQFEVSQKQLQQIRSTTQLELSVDGVSEKQLISLQPIHVGKQGTFIGKAPVAYQEHILSGMKGKAKIIKE